MRVLCAILVLATGGLAGCIGSSDPDEAVAPNALPSGFSGTHVFPGKYVTEGDFARVLASGPFEILPDETVEFQSAYDGVAMQIGLVRPDVPAGTRVPVIVFASPYLAPLHTISFRERLERFTDNFVSHGYAVALVPVRGTADHGGCMDLMGPAERADLDQAVTWLGEAEWSNGAIGMIGVSYDGSTPWEVAAAGNPYLKTIVPISGVNDIFDLMFRNGTSESRGPILLNTLYYLYGFGFNNPANGRAPEHTVTGVLCPESLEGIAVSAHSGATGDPDPLGFWVERNSRPGVEESYRGSIFLVHGLQDWNVDPHHAYPWVNELEERGIVVKHLLGQWAHAWPDTRPEESEHARWDWAQVLLHWFDRELKGDATVDIGPRAQVEDSSGRWRSEPMGWPPLDADARTLYLAPDASLAWEEPTGSASFPLVPQPATPASGLVPEPARAAVEAAFTLPAADAEWRFAGLPKVHVTVTPTGPGGHIAAFLYAESGGERQRLGWGQIDLRFADGTGVSKPVTPGEPLVARLEIEPLDAVVPAGASLVLVVNQASYGDHVTSTPTYPVRLEVGGSASTLTIHTFERGPDVFFTPPGKGDE